MLVTEKSKSSLWEEMSCVRMTRKQRIEPDGTIAPHLPHLHLADFSPVNSLGCPCVAIPDRLVTSCLRYAGGIGRLLPGLDMSEFQQVASAGRPGTLFALTPFLSNYSKLEGRSMQCRGTASNTALTHM